MGPEIEALIAHHDQLTTHGGKLLARSVSDESCARTSGTTPRQKRM